MNDRCPFDDLPPDASQWPVLLRRLTVIEHNQRDILFLLRSLRPALHAVDTELSPHTRRIHRDVIRMAPFNGLCPCCLETPVVTSDGTLIPPVAFDHFFGPVYSAPVHSWLICQPCYRALNNDQHLTWHHRLITRFRRYQAAVAAYAGAFGRRTPARMYYGKTASPDKGRPTG